MKKLILLSCLAFMSFLIAQGQKKDNDKKKKKTDYIGSVHLGLRYTTINGTDASSYNGRIGFQVGGDVNVVDFTQQLRLVAGLNLATAGAKYDDGGYSGKENLMYLNVPVLARFHSPSGFFAEAGIQPGFLLSAKDKFQGETMDIKQYLNKVDVGIPVGVGYDFKNHAGVCLQVVPGVAKLNKEGTGKYHNYGRRPATPVNAIDAALVVDL